MNRWQKLMLLTMTVAFVLFLSAACALFASDYATIDYPDAVQESQKVDFGGILGLESAYYASYRSQDSFKDVMAWYVNRFEMDTGDEPAHTNCFKLYGRQELLIATEHLIVDICQTPGKGQLIYVKRFYVSNWPDWRR